MKIEIMSSNPIDLTRIESLPVNDAKEVAAQGLIKLKEQFSLMA